MFISEENNYDQYKSTKTTHYYTLSCLSIIIIKKKTTVYTRGYGNQSGRCGEMIDCDLDNLQWYNRICVYFTRKGGGGNHVAFYKYVF